MINLLTLACPLTYAPFAPKLDAMLIDQKYQLINANYAIQKNGGSLRWQWKVPKGREGTLAVQIRSTPNRTFPDALVPLRAKSFQASPDVSVHSTRTMFALSPTGGSLQFCSDYCLIKLTWTAKSHYTGKGLIFSNPGDKSLTEKYLRSMGIIVEKEVTEALKATYITKTFSKSAFP